MPKNAEDLGILNVAKGFKKFPKVQLIAQSGPTGPTVLTGTKLFAVASIVARTNRYLHSCCLRQPLSCLSEHHLSVIFNQAVHRMGFSREETMALLQQSRTICLRRHFWRFVCDDKYRIVRMMNCHLFGSVEACQWSQTKLARSDGYWKYFELINNI